MNASWTVIAEYPEPKLVEQALSLDVSVADPEVDDLENLTCENL